MNECVLVTGASRGIGRELVRQYLACGATVVAATRSPAPGLDDFPGGRLLSVRLDVADPDSVARAADEVGGRLSRLDVLFNNAGAVGRHDRFGDFTVEGFLDTFRVNTAGPVGVTRAFLPLLRSAGHGRVLTLTSRTGVLTESGSARAGCGYGYGASKAALHRLLPLLAADLLGQGVTAVGIDPGFVETDMTRGYAAGRYQLDVGTCVKGLRLAADALRPEHAGCFLRWDGCRCRWFAPAEDERDLQMVPPSLPEPYALEPPPPRKEGTP